MYDLLVAVRAAEPWFVGPEMKLTSLLGKHLKDDDVIEVLEHFDIQVVYAFDRTHENIDDVYWAAARPAGFQFRFNRAQILDVIFCYIVENEGFSPIDQEIIGVPVYNSFDSAERDCRDRGLPFKTSDATKGPKHNKWWLRIESPEYNSHYQFRDAEPLLVTLSIPQS